MSVSIPAEPMDPAARIRAFTAALLAVGFDDAGYRAENHDLGHLSIAVLTRRMAPDHTLSEDSHT